MRAHFDCFARPVCQADNLQMSAPTPGGYKAKECSSSAPAARERRDASWPRPPLGLKDTLTGSLSCTGASHTGTHTHRDICLWAILTHLCMCMLASRPANELPRVHVRVAIHIIEQITASSNVAEAVGETVRFNLKKGAKNPETFLSCDQKDVFITSRMLTPSISPS